MIALLSAICIGSTGWLKSSKAIAGFDAHAVLDQGQPPLRAEKEIGTIKSGKLADLVILDADPLEDIRNLRKIWKVIQGERVVEREALQNWTKREAEEVANISKK